MNIEKTIIAQIFNAPKEDQIDYYTQLEPKYFYEPTWRSYFLAFGKILLDQKEEVNSVSIYNECKDKDWYDYSHISDFAENPTVNKLDKNVAILKERHYRKELLSVTERGLKKLQDTKWHDELVDVKDALIADMDTMSLDTGSDEIDFDLIEQNIKDNMRSIDKINGYSWGISDLDAITNGITVPRMITIGALKKSGKSRFVIHCRKELKKQGIHSPFLSLEMPPQELGNLHYSAHLGIPDWKLRSSAYLTPTELNRVKELKMDWTYYPTECVSRIELPQVLARIRKYSKLYPKCVIFIDYLQRIAYNPHDEVKELARISNALADATREYNVSIVALAQLQNIAEREVPNIGHLKGSGGIGEAPDTIILMDNIYRRSKDEEKKGMFQFHVEQRYGESGIIDLWSNLGTCNFGESIERVNNHPNKEDY